MWLIILSDQLRIVALVSRYLTNKLIRRSPILERPKALISSSCEDETIWSIRHRFQCLSSALRAGWLRVTHPFATLLIPEGMFAFDLHVLSSPPAFVLSQDQTLRSRRVAAFGKAA